MVGSDPNSIYLTDSNSYVIWSLRLGEVCLQRDCRRARETSTDQAVREFARVVEADYPCIRF